MNYSCLLHMHWSELSKLDQLQAHRNVSEENKCLTSILIIHLRIVFNSVHIWFHLMFYTYFSNEFKMK